MSEASSDVQMPPNMADFMLNNLSSVPSGTSAPQGKNETGGKFLDYVCNFRYLRDRSA